MCSHRSPHLSPDNKNTIHHTELAAVRQALSLYKDGCRGLVSAAKNCYLCKVIIYIHEKFYRRVAVARNVA